MFDNIMFDEEILFTYIGYAAGLATILTFAIQILRIIETKNVTNLSSYMYIIYSLGLVCWICLRRLHRFLYSSLFKPDYVFLYIYHSYPHHIL